MISTEVEASARGIAENFSQRQNEAFGSLQEKLDHWGSAVEMLRNSRAGRYVYPIPAEFSNWMDEQRSWRESVALIDQSYHMTDLYVRGRDVAKFVESLAINGFSNFAKNRAKQLVCCNADGFVIGDMVLFGLDDHEVSIVGRPPVANWIEYHAQLGHFDVSCERDERSVSNSKQRKTFRFEIQGPLAWQLIEKLHGGSLPPIKFFHMGEVSIAGITLRALRHGMSGAAGLEVWGPHELGAEIREAILAAGEEFGIKTIGGRAYSSAAVDSGWLPSPVPAIYSGDELADYRRWLSADSFEANASIGGSFHSENIEDFYFTPWDLDYGRLIKFDHDFVGRQALERRANEPHRKKVSLEWNSDDAVAVYQSQLGHGPKGKFMEVPTAHYSSMPFDQVLANGRLAGISTYPALLSVDRQWVSLAVVDEALRFGDEVTVVWGDKSRCPSNPSIEAHELMNVRARVCPWPYSKAARTQYRSAN